MRVQPRGQHADQRAHDGGGVNEACERGVFDARLCARIRPQDHAVQNRRRVVRARERPRRASRRRSRGASRKG